MTLPVLRVDPALLTKSGDALVAAAGDIPAPLSPLSVDGSDPLSTAIGAGAKAVEAPLSELPAVKESATSTGNNVINAAANYTETDEELGRRLSDHRFDGSPAGSPASGGSSPAGGGGAGAGAGGNGPAGSSSAAAPSTGAAPTAGSVPSTGGSAAGSGGAASGGQNMAQQFGQMPMQMAQQAGQIPQQLGGMMGSAPQGAMQGMQSATQQVSQMAGQFGKQDAGGEDPSGADHGATDEPAEERSNEPEGAASANEQAERAPVKQTGEPDGDRQDSPTSASKGLDPADL